MTSSHTPSRDSGLTLTELLITISMLVLVAGVIAAAVTIVFRSEAGIFNTVSESHDVQQAVNYFHLDVESGPAMAATYKWTAARGTGCLDSGDENVLQFDTDPDGDASDLDRTDDRRIAYKLTSAGSFATLDRYECKWVGGAWVEESMVNVADRLDNTAPPAVAITVVPDATGLVDRVDMSFAHSVSTRTVSAAPRAEAGLLALGIGDCSANPLDAALGFGTFIEGDVHLDNTPAPLITLAGSFGVGGTLTWEGPRIDVLANLGNGNNTLAGVNQIAMYISDIDWGANNSPPYSPPLGPTPPTGVIATFGASNTILGGTENTDYWVLSGSPDEVYGDVATFPATGARIYTNEVHQPTELTAGPIDFPEQFEILKACANALASMPYNSDHEFVTPTYQAGGTRIQLDWAAGNNAKVFNIPESYLSGVNEITLASNVSNQQALIVNFMESVDVGDPPAGEDGDDDFTLDLDLPFSNPTSQYTRVLYNFTNMEGVVTIERDIWGTIFAPFATVVTRGDVHGSVIAKQWTHEGGLIENGTNQVFNTQWDWSAP